jgi:hypothetical protein
MRRLVEKLSLKKNNSSLAKGEARRPSVTEDIGLKLIYENSQCDIESVLYAHYKAHRILT